MLSLIYSIHEQVIAPVRNPSSLESFKDKIDIRIVDMSSVDSVEDGIRGGDVVVSFLGSGSFLNAINPTKIYSESARNILKAMKRLNLTRVLLTTSVGVDFDSNFSWLYRVLIRRAIMNTYMDMMKLETIVEESYEGMDWTLLRPSYLFDSESSQPFFVNERYLRHGSSSISRKDFAMFAIHEIENGLWIRGHAAVGYL
jgi:putative NADH-flavin reductase